MNAGLADSFQLASGGVLYQYTGHNFAHACDNSGMSVITQSCFEMAVPFRVCSLNTPLTHEEVKRNLEDLPESIAMSNFSYLRLNPRYAGPGDLLFKPELKLPVKKVRTIVTWHG